MRRHSKSVTALRGKARHGRDHGLSSSQTTSQSTPMRVSSVVERMLENSGGDITTIDLSKVTDEDLASIMNVVELELSPLTPDGFRT